MKKDLLLSALDHVAKYAVFVHGWYGARFKRLICSHKYQLWYNYYGPPNKRYDESYRVRNNRSMWFCTKCQKTKVEDYAFYG